MLPSWSKFLPPVPDSFSCGPCGTRYIRSESTPRRPPRNQRPQRAHSFPLDPEEYRCESIPTPTAAKARRICKSFESGERARKIRHRILQPPGQWTSPQDTPAKFPAVTEGNTEAENDAVANEEITESEAEDAVAALDVEECVAQ